MDQFTRGSVIRVTSVPKDVDGNLIFPITVTAYLNYVTLTGRASTSITLSKVATDGPYEGDWDTSDVADMRPGVVEGSVRSADPDSGEDFQLEIVANAANPGV